jgi:site-specific recombinase XerD
MSDSLDPWIEGYLEYTRDVKKLAKRSVVDKRCTLKKVTEKMARIRPGIPLWKLTLQDYVQWVNMEREDGTSEFTIQKDLSHLRGLIDYAWRAGKTDRNVLDGFYPKDATMHKEPPSLTLEEAEGMVHAYSRKTKKERRDRMVILLLYGCGLRTMELRELNVTDVDVERQEIEVFEGKGGKGRRIPVAEMVWGELMGYLVDRGGKRGPDCKGGSASVRTIERCDAEDASAHVCVALDGCRCRHQRDLGADGA